MGNIFSITIRQEVSRCLLCYDPPCSKACPAHHEPDRMLRSLFFNNRAGAAAALQAGDSSRPCPEGCKGKHYCQKACIRGKIDHPVDIQLVRAYLQPEAGDGEGEKE